MLAKTTYRLLYVQLKIYRNKSQTLRISIPSKSWPQVATVFMDDDLQSGSDEADTIFVQCDFNAATAVSVAGSVSDKQLDG